ncbi:zinc ribbon domain-containing protein [Actinotalea ferrariae]|nr:zinc ribbon domain-containing protein [Actinotalea ferrariae]
MPLYEYRCIDGGHRFEESRPIARRHETSTCGTCGGIAALVPMFAGITGRARARLKSESDSAPAQSSSGTHGPGVLRVVGDGNLQMVGNVINGGGLVIEPGSRATVVADRNWFNGPIAIENNGEATVIARGNRHRADPPTRETKEG